MRKRVCLHSRQLAMLLLGVVAFLWLVGIAAAQEKYVYKQMWPKLEQPWYFNSPEGVAVDTSGNVYVADTKNYRIHKFTSDDKFIAKWGSKGSGDGQFDRPYGITLDNSGNVYVADTYNNRIQKFTSDGKFITKWGSFGSGDGQFAYLQGITVDGNSNVYVVDQGNDRIQKFTSDGNFIAKWGSNGSGDGQFAYLQGIAVDGSGNVYVVDQGNGRIQKFTSDGKFITKWGSNGSYDGQFVYLHGIAVDGSGNVYVSDSSNSRINKFTSDGKFITKWGSFGSYDGQFIQPIGIAVDDSGNVYVSDSSNSRINKFTSDGKFIAKLNNWGSGDGQFSRSEGIAVDGSGNVYVVDLGNGRIQKFTSDGKFITKWGSSGSGDGQFSHPTGIAVDASGNVYVTEYNNNRIQKFTSDGKFITKWGGNEQFSAPWGIAIDGSGNVYVADFYNDRIQKFTPDGKFIAKWGSSGSGDGQFSHPTGIAVDASGNVYVADFSNYRIQKFTSDGRFIAKWGNKGSDEGQFFGPAYISLDDSGNVYVTDYANHRIQKFSYDGKFITRFGEFGSNTGQVNFPAGVSISKNGDIYVADKYNDRVQVFTLKTSTAPDKAIIVAGSGPYQNNTNNLWNATQMNATYAYYTLNRQGFDKDNIYYLTAGNSQDLDNNGLLDDMYSGVSNAKLQQAITEWAKGANNVVIYLTGHGGEGKFRINEKETLASTDLASWINTLQQDITGKITVVYDACESGSFIGDLKPTTGKERINITSTASTEEALFVNSGTVSFSYPFWSQVSSGATVYNAFKIARDTINYMKWNQTPNVDDNGNGLGNEPADGNLAETYTIGNGTQSAADMPFIGSVSPDQTLNGQQSAKIRAENVVTSDKIQKVWALIKRPDSAPSNPDEPITSLPSIDLTDIGSNAYEGTYDYFDVSGAYEIAVYAMDSKGGLSLPKATTVTQTGGASTGPKPAITANGAKDTINIKTTDTLTITVALDAGGFSGQNADWWLQALTDFGAFYYDVVGGSWSWRPGKAVTYMGPLFNLGQTEVLRMSGLPVGTYSFSFQADLTMDGKKNGQVYSDTVAVIVSQ
ncbi:6-bladed beta-propeller [Candidatus Magnetobacterium casense]|uniref:NHL repeat containing protein n=1 Tax=Candidatus Magnetobacterium casense TaxID=1455061 RepID=A0ABS6RYC9_9BACT|nr:6-bladed beta-propeller [Candidatus Magnetobacterium casensis]MBV6341335.1 hypothetical protein [Candidatus Magnetobacterium casensis]